jgi:hypothetical protein
MRRKTSILLFILFIIGLYVLLNKGVVPLVTKVAESDLFDVKEEGEEPLGKVKNERTDFALMHCKAALIEDRTVPENAEFEDQQYEAWALGNNTYILRSVVLTNDSKEAGAHKFACKLRLTGDDQTDPKSWTILGVDFNPGEE